MLDKKQDNNSDSFCVHFTTIFQEIRESYLSEKAMTWYTCRFLQFFIEIFELELSHLPRKL